MWHGLPDGLAEARRRRARADLARAHGQQRDLDVEVDQPLDDDPLFGDLFDFVVYDVRSVGCVWHIAFQIGRAHV